MNNLASGTNKRFRSLLDAVADYFGSRRATPGDGVGSDISKLGPSVGGDGKPGATMLGSSVGGDGKPGAAVLGRSVGGDNFSDVRLKEEIQHVGTTVFGLPLYHFKYIGRPETYEGVMAQDVLGVMPNAVSCGADGYYRVNYSTLGTSMRRVS